MTFVCVLLRCSGGKDSCYSMVLCQKYGHEVSVLPVPALHSPASARSV
jgi:diphthamide synthase (EF-2-diphthine--ammonia ligase)